MISSTYDLPMHGNYFAEDGYLTHDPKSGTIRNRAGARMLALTDDFLAAAQDTLEAEFGERAPAVLAAAAQDWGRRAAEQFAAEMEQYHGRPLAQLPLSLFAADLTEAFRRHGWGILSIDFAQHPYGLLLVEVKTPISSANTSGPVDALLAGFLAGMFSQFTGATLDCLKSDCPSRGASQSRFVLTVPERLHAVDGWVARGKGHAEILADLKRARESR